MSKLDPSKFIPEQDWAMILYLALHSNPLGNREKFINPTEKVPERKKRKSSNEIPIPPVSELMDVFHLELDKGKNLKKPCQIKHDEMNRFCTILRAELVKFRQKFPRRNPKKGEMLKKVSILVFGKNHYVRGSSLKPGMTSSIIHSIFHHLCQNKRFKRNVKRKKNF